MQVHLTVNIIDGTVIDSSYQFTTFTSVTCNADCSKIIVGSIKTGGGVLWLSTTGGGGFWSALSGTWLFEFILLLIFNRLAS